MAVFFSSMCNSALQRPGRTRARCGRAARHRVHRGAPGLGGGRGGRERAPGVPAALASVGRL